MYQFIFDIFRTHVYIFMSRTYLYRITKYIHIYILFLGIYKTHFMVSLYRWIRNIYINRKNTKMNWYKNDHMWLSSANETSESVHAKLSENSEECSIGWGSLDNLQYWDFRNRNGRYPSLSRFPWTDRGDCEIIGEKIFLRARLHGAVTSTKSVRYKNTHKDKTHRCG